MIPGASISTNLQGSFSFKPEAINGTWEGSWVFTGTKGGGTSQTVARGTDELAGKTLFLSMVDAPVFDPEEAQPYCDLVGGFADGKVLLEGIILDTTTP